MNKNEDIKPFGMKLRSHKKRELNETKLNSKEDAKKTAKGKLKNTLKTNKKRNITIKKEESKEDINYESDSSYKSNSNNASDSDFEMEKGKTKQKISRKRKRKDEEEDTYIQSIKKECEINMKNLSENIPQQAYEVRQKLNNEIIPGKKKILMRYFKTGPGDYADGDMFFGIPVPGIRSCLKSFPSLDFESLFWLITSSYHEERMFATLYLTNLSKKIAKEEQKKQQNIKETYHLVLDNINDSLKKNQCHTIPELVQHFSTKSGCIPGHRKDWDIFNNPSSDKRQKEKRERIGESRPIFLDAPFDDLSGEIHTPIKNSNYQYYSTLGLTDILKIQKQILFEFYVECMPWIDNWDLVDLTSRDIIGGFLQEFDYEQIKNILYHWITYKVSDQVVGYSRLKNGKNKSMGVKKEEEEKVDEETKYESLRSDYDLSVNTIWTKRVAIISTFYFINHSDYRYTIFIMEKLLNFEDEEIHGPSSKKKPLHDLIEKASGWMLREIGKKDGSSQSNSSLKSKNLKKKENGMDSFDLYLNKQYTLIHFLNRYAWKMPRMMLRYSIEKFPISERKKYLNATEPLE